MQQFRQVSVFKCFDRQNGIFHCAKAIIALGKLLRIMSLSFLSDLSEMRGGSLGQACDMAAITKSGLLED